MLILFPFDLVVISRDLIGAALRLLTFVVVYRCSNLSDRRDLRQAISLSFVQILAAAAATTEAYFSFFLAAYLLIAIWTLMAMASTRTGAPASVRRVPGGRPAAAMTASTLAIGGALFFVIPHFGTGTFHPVSILRGEGDGLTGFADRIELGSIGRIKQSRAIVMRVHVDDALDPSSLPVRWRGVALDTFDGRSWSASSGSRRWVERDGDGMFRVGSLPPASRDPFSYEVSMLPVLVPVLFTTPGPARIVSDDISSLGIDTDGSIHLPAPRIRRFSYRVVSEDPGTALHGYGRGGPSPSGSARYLALPRLDPRVSRLANAVTAEAETDFERARRIEEYLRSNYTYSLDVNDAGVTDPVEHFLLERNPGHCEYFATSMAVMLRHLGIPSRVVNGFQSGEWSALTSSFIVRQADAHAWVEAWMPERGWVTFDPTPSSAQIAAHAGVLGRFRARLSRLEVMWDTWIVGLDLLDQESVLVGFAEAARGAAMSAAQTLGGLLERAAGSTGRRLGFPAAIAAVAAFLSLGALGGVRLIGALRRRRHGARPGSPAAARAARAFRRFEARWAARGVRRLPGQTPYELAVAIARHDPESSDTARAFIESYYAARYGA